MKIVFDKVSKGYPARTGNVFHQVIADLTLKIDHPGVYCFFGASGSGKTTLLYLLAGLIEADYGRAGISGIDKRTGFIFQEDMLLQWKTAWENVELVSPYRNKTEKLFISAGLENKINCYPGQLSVGERQRVNIVRALASSPKILFLDEPFSHLDELIAARLRLDITDYLIKSCQYSFLVTHNPYEALYMSDHLYLIQDQPLNNIILMNNILNRRHNKLSYTDFISLKSVNRKVKDIYQNMK